MLLLVCIAISCSVQASSALVVAASDSPETSKTRADYICDGVADQIEIQRALNALGTRGGTVSLTEGTFHLSGDLNIPSNVIFEGQGPDATWLEWSSGRVKCEWKENIILRDFKTTGTGSIYLLNCNHVKVHNITATVDDSLDGGAFYLYVGYSVMEDIEFVNCKAIDCGRHGWQNDGEGSPKTIRDVRYIDCEAINCGRYSRFAHYGQWTCGFVLAENADIEDIEVVRCYAEGSFESGFHFEAAPSKKRIVLRDCVSKSNGQKPDDYYNPDTRTYGCTFGAGFWLHGDVTLINCTAEGNRKCGYAVWYPSSYTNLYNCVDTGSEIGYLLDWTDNVYLENCISIDATKYGVWVMDSGQITTKGLAIVTPKGDGSANNIFGSSWYPVRESSFDIDTYGGEGTAVSCSGGQNIQFSGTVRSNAARPVTVSGSVDTSRLSVRPYSGEQPMPVTPTPTPTPSRKPDLVVTDIAWDPVDPVSGDLVTFQATVTNQGNAPTPGGVSHRVCFTVGDGTTGSSVWSDGHTTSIAPGASVTLTANAGPAGATWKAVAGTHTVTAYVDDVDRIAESDEDNNMGTVRITVMKPTEDPSDAQGPYKQHTVPGRINFVDFDYGGEGVAYHDTEARNQGGYTYRTDDADVDIGERDGVGVPVIACTYAGEWLKYSQVQVGTTGTYDATFSTSTTEDGKFFSVLVDGEKVATVNVPNTGSWFTFAPTTVQIPLTAGEHTLQIFMDTGWDDLAYVDFKLTPSKKPDLVVTDIVWDPVDPISGDLVTFQATVTNQGNAPTPGGVSHRVCFTVGDGTTGSSVWSDGHTTSIAPGASVTLTANAGPAGATWKAVAGTHTVTAHVDDVDRIAESDEDNNTLRKEIVVRSQPVPIRGDVNGDGSVDWADVTMVADMVQGNVAPSSAADLNEDGTVDWEDVALLFDFFFGRIPSL